MKVHGDYHFTVEGVDFRCRVWDSEDARFLVLVAPVVTDEASLDILSSNATHLFSLASEQTDGAPVRGASLYIQREGKDRFRLLHLPGQTKLPQEWESPFIPKAGECLSRDEMNLLLRVHWAPRPPHTRVMRKVERDRGEGPHLWEVQGVVTATGRPIEPYGAYRIREYALDEGPNKHGHDARRHPSKTVLIISQDPTSKRDILMDARDIAIHECEQAGRLGANGKVDMQGVSVYAHYPENVQGRNPERFLRVDLGFGVSGSHGTIHPASHDEVAAAVGHDNMQVGYAASARKVSLAVQALFPEPAGPDR